MVHRCLTLLAGLLLTLPVQALELVTEVIPLGYRTVSEVAPILRPLVPAPGAVTGLRDQLVIRTTPDNLAEVKGVLASLDRAPRSLLISVKRTTLDRAGRQGYGARLDVHEGNVRIAAGGGGPGQGGAMAGVGNDDSRGGVRVYGTDSRADLRGVQAIRTLEGRDAFISAGVEVPLRERYRAIGPYGVTSSERLHYRRVDRGFFARPLVQGDQVRVEIRSTDSRLGHGPRGLIQRRDADTVVSGPLGEWLVVGRDAREESRSRGGIAYSAGSETLSDSVLMMKVEVIR